MARSARSQVSWKASPVGSPKDALPLTSSALTAIAHEIGHLYDATGAQYDFEGRFRQWWSNETVAAFQEHTKCIEKQYSKSVFCVLELGNATMALG
jgi:predicted metalloendopeptidase